MNMRKLMSAAAALAVVMAAVGAAGSGLPRPMLSLRENLSVGGLDDETLFQWTGLTVDQDGNIYVLDAMDFSLKKFDPNGLLTAKTGRKGQGPGEFTAPRLLDASDRYLYATDQGVMGVMVFDHRLNYLRTIRTPSLVLHLKALPGGRIGVLSASMEGKSEILILDNAEVTVDTLDYMDRKGGLLQDSVSFAGYGKSGFVIAFLFQDRVERWADSGTRAWSKSLLGGTPVRTKKIEGYTVPAETCFNDVAVDSHGFIYVLAGSRARHPARDILVLNADGSPFQTITLPDSSHCVYIDRKDQLYARANEGITLKRYEIRYE
jgi:hypothetical protein